MIRFLKELYLTGFAIIVRTSRAKEAGSKWGSAISFVAVVEVLILLTIADSLEMSFNKRLPTPSKPEVILFIAALFFANYYILVIRRHGIKFAHDFDKLEKSRRILLLWSLAAVFVGAIVAFVFSAIAYHRFIHAD